MVGRLSSQKEMELETNSEAEMGLPISVVVNSAGIRYEGKNSNSVTVSLETSFFSFGGNIRIVSIVVIFKSFLFLF